MFYLFSQQDTLASLNSKFCLPHHGQQLNSLFNPFSLRGLFPTTHAYLTTQPVIWTELTCRIWDSPSVSLSFLGFSPYSPVAMVTLNTVLTGAALR